MEPIIISSLNFEQEVLNNKGLVLIDFWAEWCGPCQMMIPILHDFAAEMGESVKVGKVNVDENPDIARTFRIMSIPTLILFKDGKPVEQVVGVQQIANLKSLCEKYK